MEDAEGLALAALLIVDDLCIGVLRWLRVHHAASGLTVDALSHVGFDLTLLSLLLSVEGCMSNSGRDMPAHTRCIFEVASLVSWGVHCRTSASDALVGFVVANGVFKNVAVLIKIAL